MPTDETTDDQVQADADEDEPSLRQKLHAATGDRDAEAEALADDAGGDVTPSDAKVAVQQARGEAAGEPKLAHDMATPADAEAEAAKHAN